jgi:hypothetical protein
MGEKTRETLKLQFDKRLTAGVPRGQDNLGCRAAGLSRTGRGAGIDGDGTDDVFEPMVFYA